ncbi:hypothetical protein P7D22_17035 [Lichenihabitans sp. Uapishka_5]|uniref:5-methylcytosine restriction system specificity protein McrC n=1 Tax=Lichenihabitans sp. Uapishka_5 TaxID=3037302 RepID=UPI0029E7D143|nr:hypothetical protein [Lichenihabitans sp. Uapishka_5]MDX7952873.1 hypothetical protein [Lichenihabitans sp. Uapishka_5]
MAPARVIELDEQADSFLPHSALDPSEALAIASDQRLRVDVSWPSPANAFKWVLRPRGWVGSFMVAERLVVRIKPKTPVPRIFELQRIAGGDLEREPELALVPAGTLQDAMEAVVRVLVRAVSNRLARGLRKDYVHDIRTGQVPRGRLRLRDSTLRFASGRPSLCWDERFLTVDIDDNRILAFTLFQVSRIGLQDRSLATDVAHVQRLLAMMTSHRSYIPDRCRGRAYAGADQDYGALHAMCALLLEGIGPTADEGTAPFPQFGFDMPTIFERAVAALLRTRLRPGLRLVEKPTLSLGAGMRFRPDLVVVDVDGRAKAVLDTKYKTQLVESDVQQAVAYATALDVNKAFLIHPVPVGRGSIEAGRVSVTTLTFDLARDPSTAADDLVAAMRASLVA